VATADALRDQFGRKHRHHQAATGEREDGYVGLPARNLAPQHLWRDGLNAQKRTSSG